MIKTVAICAAILAAAAAVAALTFATEPSATRGGARVQTAMLVDVTSAERGTFSPTIVATGVVEPAQDVELSPQVTGEVIALAPELSPGGFVTQGEVLLRVEPADYRHTLAQRESDLRQAIADMSIEMGRQNIAREDYELFGKSLPDDSKALVLREPQLEAAQVRVDAARAAVDQARLDLRRTTVRAPFDAHVLSREVNVGSRVSPGQPLARLVGLDTYWVVVTVPLNKLRWIELPDGEGEIGAEVQVRNRATWPEGVTRTGHVYRLIGALDEQTRMARVLVVVDDPLARGPDAGGAPPLIVGEFLETRIRGVQLENVVRLDRAYLRAGDTVWVMQDDGTLDIRDVDIVMRDATHAYIAGGIDEGDKVVTTNLATVTDGAKLRVRGAEEAPAP